MAAACVSGACLFKQSTYGHYPIAPFLELWQNLSQHWSSPTPPVMTNDDATSPCHTRDMSCVHPSILNLGIMRIDASKHQSIAQLLDQGAHLGIEEAGPRPEVMTWHLPADGMICIVYPSLYI